jgi:hypothetical protein
MHEELPVFDVAGYRTDAFTYVVIALNRVYARLS